MAINTWIMCEEAEEGESECLLALGDNTSALGWIHHARRLDKESPYFQAVQLIARKIATVVSEHGVASQRDISSAANTRIIIGSRVEARSKTHDRHWRRLVGYLRESKLDYDSFVSLSDEERLVVSKGFSCTLRAFKFTQEWRVGERRRTPLGRESIEDAGRSVDTSRLKVRPFYDSERRKYQELEQLFRVFKDKYPPRRVQKAITPKFLRALHDTFRKPGEPVANIMHSQLVDLYFGSFFFAGRCEFCLTTKPGRTTRVTIADVEFKDATVTLVMLTEATDLVS